MDFAQSPRSTVGIEWELQLIDKDSFDLRQNAETVMEQVEALPRDTSTIHREMLLNTVELVSRPHARVADCVADLADGIAMLEPIVDPLRISLGAGGTHPFASPGSQLVTRSERYLELVNRTQYWGRQMLLFGTHVHVGVEDRAKVLPIIRALLTRHGHLQSLTAASPIWDGVLTGYADNRAMVFQQLPTAGLPIQFDSWDELEGYVHDMTITGVFDEFNEVRWDIRPSPNFGTIEMRICDAAANLLDVSAIAALTQCLVEYFSRMYDAGERLPSMPDWLVSENKWRSARYGMDAILITDDAGHETLVSETIFEMVELLRPVARDLDCVAELEHIERAIQVGVPYQRQMLVYEETQSRTAVVRLMLAEMAAGRPLNTADFLNTL